MGEYGVTQKALAEKLGVSRPAVAQWANGKERLPLIRAEQLAADFNVPVSRFAQMVGAANYGDAWATTTILGWLLQDGSMLGHIGNSVVGRISIMSETLSIPFQRLFGAATGQTLLTTADAKVLMEVYLPGVNPVILDAVVSGETEPEDEHVAKLALGIGTYEGMTFADLYELLEQAEQGWRNSRKEASDLDDGRPVPELLLKHVAMYPRK